jgi:hypothetical protein
MFNFLLLSHLAVTLFMAGAIWIVQIVHYPLFNQVGMEAFPAYENAHTILITPVVGIPMVIEALTGFLLLVARPPSLPVWAPVVGGVLVSIIWVATLVLQIPQHTILAGGFDQTAYEALVSGNWVRTIAWTLRAGLVLWMVWQVMA